MTGMQPHFGLDGEGAYGAAVSLLRRSLVIAARDDGSVQDQIDCAELALAAGAPDSARLLYDVLFLRTGFSPARQNWQRAIAARTGLWRDDEPFDPAAEEVRSGSSIDIAIAELTRLIERIADLPALPVSPIDFIRPYATSADAPVAPPPLPPFLPALADGCRRLCRLLRAPLAGGAGGDLAALLAQFDDRIGGAAPIGVSNHLGAPIEQLCAIFAYDRLRGFLLTRRDLFRSPFGSAALFHAAARLDPAGLGPYFDNVGRLLRTSRDLFGLIRLAHGDRAEIAPDSLERWLILLSADFDKATLLDLIDELADRRLTRAMGALLDVIGRSAPARRDHQFVWRLRDGALDIGDVALAIRAQELAVLWSADNRVEWTILGDINATVGDIPAARRAYARCMTIAPRNPGTRDRLTALRTGRFDCYAVVAGFGTPKARQNMRLARRE